MAQDIFPETNTAAKRLTRFSLSASLRTPVFKFRNLAAMNGMMFWRFFVENRPGGFFGEDFDAWAIRKTCQLKEGKFRVQYLRPRSAILHHPLEKIPLKESNQLTISGPVSPTVYTKETLSKMAKMRQAHPKKNCVSNYEETLYPLLLPSKKKNFRMKKGCFSYLPRLHESFALPIHIWLVVVSQAI